MLLPVSCVACIYTGNLSGAVWSQRPDGCISRGRRCSGDRHGGNASRFHPTCFRGRLHIEPWIRLVSLLFRRVDPRSVSTVMTVIRGDAVDLHLKALTRTQFAGTCGAVVLGLIVSSPFHLALLACRKTTSTAINKLRHPLAGQACLHNKRREPLPDMGHVFPDFAVAGIAGGAQ